MNTYVLGGSYPLSKNEKFVNIILRIEDRFVEYMGQFKTEKEFLEDNKRLIEKYNISEENINVEKHKQYIRE